MSAMLLTGSIIAAEVLVALADPVRLADCAPTVRVELS